ncbi:SelT/SelW/SelH family protein [Bacillus sp. HMF5848]|nr:SelT/SelW/SelH family protein [Bacillus sp. HMF5848]
MFTHFRSQITSFELVPSSKGAFEVFVNDEKIYSKLETGVFPDTKTLISDMEK